MPVAPGVAIPLAEVDLRASRSSGPGGQHANVTASRVEAVFDVETSESLDAESKRRIVERAGPVVRAVAQESRGQARNRELALERLQERLSAALKRPKKRRPTRPSRTARERRLEGKRRQSVRKRQRRAPGPDD